ncbi:MAG: [protein-PII] uridylyltransferase [Kiloniellales bacterium]
MSQARPGPRNQRAILDRRRLSAALEAVAAEVSPDEKRRDAVLGLMKAALRDGEAEVGRRFDASGHGAEVMAGRCFLIDQLIRVLYDFALGHVYRNPNPTAAEQIAVVAVGGYGRGELAPRSDVDLLFVLSYKETPWVEQVIEYLLYMLWDLGLQVGHATRSVPDCMRRAKADMTIRTSVLEARYVWGSQALYRDLRLRFRNELMAGRGTDFVEAKLNERNERHLRMGDSRYVLEPNVKDGKGGLRDLHTLFWIAKYLYRVTEVRELVARGVLRAAEARQFAKAQNLLWTLRCHLHYLTGRAEERLTFDLQPEISRRMGYADREGASGVEQLMKHYFLAAKDVGDLTRIFCAGLEAEHRRKPLLRLPKLRRRRKEFGDFRLDGDRLNVVSDRVFEDDPVNFLRLFHIAQENQIDIHPRALRLIRQSINKVNAKLRADPEANRLFLDVLTSPKDPEISLRRMNEAGVLGRFIPDFGRVVAQMQFDMYHVHTVDEHTIYAIGILSRIEAGEFTRDHPVSSEVVHQVLSRRVLYLALLLHDVAKGRGGNHSVIGARVARRLCPRLGLTEEETETVAWLVRYHLLMSYAAFKRDIDDPKTVSDFVELVRSPERLRLLLVLTVADLRAVGPKVWNEWKATLLRELYYQAEDLMTGGLDARGKEQRVAAARAALRAALPDWSDEAFRAHAGLGYDSYLLAFDTATLARHARLVREAEGAVTALTVDARVIKGRGVTEVTVYTADHPGLFSRIAGAIAVSGANIVDARIHTLTNGMALDTFAVQDVGGGTFDGPAKLKRLEANIDMVLSGRLRLHEALRRAPALPSRTRVFKVAPRVLIDNKASRTHTVIEVNGRDRRGLLHDVTRALTRTSVQISSAKVSTYGESVVDVFYVKDLFGMKIEQPAKLKQIKQTLLAALADPTGAPEVVAAGTKGPVAKTPRRQRATARQPAAAE